jgi:hypothetical protein
LGDQLNGLAGNDRLPDLNSATLESLRPPMDPQDMTLNEPMRQIEETERLIAVYHNADEVIVGTEDQIYSRRGLINRITLTPAEIGDQIVNILERRLAAMRVELQKLEGQGESR